MKLSVVIPVYNEVSTILEVLRQVKAIPVDKEIIIVDDCSTDGTREILQELKEDPIKVILNEENRGKGYCLREAFQHVSGDVVIIQEADLEYYPDEYHLLLKKIQSGKADVVYGSRFMGARRVFNFYHYLGNAILNLIANILYNTNLSDLMTCYKAFRADVIKELKLEADGFGIEAEITAQVFKRRFKVYEVPISYNGRDYSEGKKITWKDFFRSVYWLLRCKFVSYDVGADTLYRIRLAVNNTRWIFERLKPYLSGKILEVGSGIGNVSAHLITLNKELILTDINPNYIRILNQKFGAHPHVRIFQHDISADASVALAALKPDTILCVNALEHIEDDEKVLDHMYQILNTGGKLVLLVPALRRLYGALDEKLGHFRRYERKELAAKLQGKGFVIEDIYFHNMVAAAGWFVNGRIFKKKIMASFQVALLDKFVPFLAWLEDKIRIPFGLSLIVVCKKQNL